MKKSTRIHAVASVVASALALAAAPAFATQHYALSSQTWGGSQFNASYSAYAGVKDKQDFIDTAPSSAIASMYSSILPADFIQVGAVADAWVTMFGHEEQVTHVDAYVSRSNGAISSQYDLDFMGVTLLSGAMPSSVNWSFGVPLFSQSKSISMGLVNVSATANATAVIGLQGSWSTANGILFSFTPQTRAYVGVDASVGALCASVDVKGSLTALKLQEPTTTSVTFPTSNSAAFNVSSSLVLTPINGSIELDANDCFSDYSTTLASYTSTTLSPSLLSANGTLSW